MSEPARRALIRISHTRVPSGWSYDITVDDCPEDSGPAAAARVEGDLDQVSIETTASGTAITLGFSACGLTWADIVLTYVARDNAAERAELPDEDLLELELQDKEPPGGPADDMPKPAEVCR